MLPLRDKANSTPEECRVVPWFSIDGDNNLRLDYDLSTSSLVYDVGGYEGAWAKNIYQKYRCNIEIFEPVKGFASKIDKKFALRPKVHTHAFGLSDKTHKTTITIDGASSSTHRTSKTRERIELVKAQDFIKQRHERIDLMKINIEGDEYRLLTHLIETGIVNNITNIQVQFHIFVPNAEKKHKQLQAMLGKTHDLTYSYPWIWDNWRLRK